MLALLQFVLFQGAWFLCAIMAGNDWVEWAWLPMTCFGLGYIAIVSSQKKADLQMLIASGCLGFVLDSILLHFGIFSTPHLDLCSPLWLVSMWMGFSVAFSMGLYRITKLPWYVILLVASVGGYASYRAGAGFGGIVLHPNSDIAMAGIMLEWIFAFPLLLFMYRKLTL